MKYLFIFFAILSLQFPVITAIFSKYLGCFVCIERRTGSFRRSPNKLNNNVIHLSDCLQSCILTGKNYVAVSYGRYCSCINQKTLSNCRMVTDLECSSHCSYKERCGGKERHSIYKLLSEKFNWAEWTVWEGCSVVCGGGVEKRRKSCQDPNECLGRELTELRKCNTFSCQEMKFITGDRTSYRKLTNVWSTWNSWSACSETCDNGEKIRQRFCYTAPCFGPRLEVKACLEQKCQGKWGWTQWTAWSDCSITRGCEIIHRRRQRWCNLPEHAKNGKICMGAIEEYKQCRKKKDCPINSSFISRGHDGFAELVGNGNDRVSVDLPPKPKKLMDSHNKNILGLVQLLVSLAILVLFSVLILLCAKRFSCTIIRSNGEGKNFKPASSYYRRLHEVPENKEQLLSNEELLNQKLATITEIDEEKSINSE